MSPDQLDSRRLETGYTLFALGGHTAERTGYPGLHEVPWPTGSGPGAGEAYSLGSKTPIDEGFQVGAFGLLAWDDEIIVPADSCTTITEHLLRAEELAALSAPSDRTTFWSGPTVGRFVVIHRPAPIEPRRASIARAPSARPSQNPAEELRNLVPELSIDDLSELCGVSRSSFYEWMKGSLPRGRNLEQLLQLGAHLRDAAKRLPAGTSLALWLRTPLAADAGPPIDYLREGRFRAFRGCVSRAHAAASRSRFPIPLSSRLPSPRLDQRQVSLALERLSPTPRMPAGDEDEGPGGSDTEG